MFFRRYSLKRDALILSVLFLFFLVGVSFAVTPAELLQSGFSHVGTGAICSRNEIAIYADFYEVVPYKDECSWSYVWGQVYNGEYFNEPRNGNQCYWYEVYYLLNTSLTPAGYDFTWCYSSPQIYTQMTNKGIYRATGYLTGIEYYYFDDFQEYQNSVHIGGAGVQKQGSGRMEAGAGSVRVGAGVRSQHFWISK